MIYYSVEHGSMAASNGQPEEAEVFGPGLTLESGDCIVDTGCRTAVAGVLWHRQHQEKLQHLGLQFEEVAQHETFKFGAGPPVESRRAFVYPVLTHQQMSWVRVAEVGGAASGCPGLIGPSEMAR